MENYWHKRSVGIKLWGFEKNPYDLSHEINAVTDATSKGEPHGTKNHFRENQLHILNLIKREEDWGEAFQELIESMGGVDSVKRLIDSVNPKNYFIVINVPESDVCCGAGNSLSIQAINIISALKCDVSINYF